MKSRRAMTRSLNDFAVMELLAFTTAWSPPINEGDLQQFPRWPDWATYFKDYDAIRALLLVSNYHQPGTILFADTVRVALAAAGPSEVWGKHRHAAWQHAHLYSRGDGHIHKGDERLGSAVEIAELDKVPTQV